MTATRAPSGEPVANWSCHSGTWRVVTAPSSRPMRTRRDAYQASSAGASVTTATTAASPSQSASHVFMPSGDSCRASPVARSTIQAVRHSSCPVVVSTTGVQRGSSAASAARSPTVPEPIPSACSACSPGDDEERGDVPSRLGRCSSGKPAGRGEPLWLADRPVDRPTSSANGAGRWRLPMSARNESRRPPSDQRGSAASTPAPVTCHRRPPSTAITCSSAWPRPSSASVTWRIVATRVPSGDTSAVETIEVDPTRRPTRSW